MVSKATKARAVAVVAPALPNAAVVLALGLGAYLLVGKILPSVGSVVGELAIKGGRELAEGTGDFFKGLYSGAEQTETPVPAIRSAEDLGTVYQLPDANLSSERMGDEPVLVLASPSPSYSDFVESPRAFYTVDFDDFGPVVTVTDPHPGIPGPVVYQTEDPSLAQEAGAGFYDWMTGPISDPVIQGTKSLLGKLF